MGEIEMVHKNSVVVGEKTYKPGKPNAQTITRAIKNTLQIRIK